MNRVAQFFDVSESDLIAKIREYRATWARYREAERALRSIRDSGPSPELDEADDHVMSLAEANTEVYVALIAAVTTGTPTPSLLRAIASLGIALELPVLAEGIEDGHQAAIVKSLGYSFAQGFHYGRPQSVNDIVSSLTNR